jgi:uncharacterized membrane protein (UPF0127 family)
MDTFVRARGPGARALLACAALLCCGCQQAAGSPPRRPPPPVSSGSGLPAAVADQTRHGAVRFETPRGTWLVDVELARTADQRARGLMWRTDLRPDTGMLFFFDESEEHRFWMRNTLLSLDMLFLDEDRVVVGVVDHAEPRTDTPRTVGRPSRYVLEVAGGEAAAHAVGPGARAAFLGIE